MARNRGTPTYQDEPEWMEHAACRRLVDNSECEVLGRDCPHHPDLTGRRACELDQAQVTEVFFTVEKRNAWRAIDICRVCPAMDQCREWALSRLYEEPHGVLGGMTEQERDRTRRERFRAARGQAARATA